MTIATIRIHDLKVRAIIGTHAWERDNKQDLILNVTIAYDAAKAANPMPSKMHWIIKKWRTGLWRPLKSPKVICWRSWPPAF